MNFHEDEKLEIHKQEGFEKVLDVVFYGMIGIMIILFGGGIFSLVCQQKYYRKLMVQFEEQKSKGVFSNSFHQNLIQNYRSTAKRDVSLINTPAMIEKHFYGQSHGFIFLERLGKQTANLLVLFGLLTAFIGFFQIISKMQFLAANTELMQNAKGTEVLLNQFMSLLEASDKALWGALLGFSLATIFMAIRVFIKPSQTLHGHFVELESYLDNVVALDFSKSSQEELLGQAIQDLFDRLTGQVENSYKKILEQSVSALVESAESNALSSQDFNMAVRKLEKILKQGEERQQDGGNR